MKQKKKQNIDNKFNFDDEYIIGVSTTASPSKTKSYQKKVTKNSKSKAKKTDKTLRNSKKMQANKAASRPKMHEKRRLAWDRIVKIVLVICLFVGAGAFLCLSPTFNVNEIIVENNNLIPADTIRSLSRIELYKNIFKIDMSDTAKYVQENPYINSVKVKRVLPNKIKIIIEERTEKYLLEFAEGKYAFLDGQGYILGVASELKELPIITGAKTNIDEILQNNGNKNRLCEKDLNRLETVANIIQTAQNYEVYSFITKIDISDEDNIKLILASEGKIVHLGNCTDLSTRILFMQEIIKSQKGKSGEMFINGDLTEKKVFFRENV